MVRVEAAKAFAVVVASFQNVEAARQGSGRKPSFLEISVDAWQDRLAAFAPRTF